MKRTLLTLAMLMVAVPAYAEDDGRWIRQARRSCDFWGHCTVRYVYVRRPEVRYYAPRRDDDDRGVRCRDVMRTVGNQHLSVSGAKAEADKAWIQMVRFHLGEAHMTLENARDVTYTCSRSSVGETLGQTFSRCEVSARPCRAQKEESER